MIDVFQENHKENDIKISMAMATINKAQQIIETQNNVTTPNIPKKSLNRFTNLEKHIFRFLLIRFLGFHNYVNCPIFFFWSFGVIGDGFTLITSPKNKINHQITKQYYQWPMPLDSLVLQYISANYSSYDVP